MDTVQYTILAVTVLVILWPVSDTGLSCPVKGKGCLHTWVSFAMQSPRLELWSTCTSMWALSLYLQPLSNPHRLLKYQTALLIMSNATPQDCYRRPFAYSRNIWQCPQIHWTRRASSIPLVKQTCRRRFLCRLVPSCRVIAPVFSKLADEHAMESQIAFVKVNIDHCKDAAKLYQT